MAYRMKTDPRVPGMVSQQKMDFIYNVTGHVGPRQTCMNKPEDVELVQFLLREVIPHWFENPTVRELPRLTGRMDAATAFWIYDIQVRAKSIMGVDGVISPAKGLVYGSHFWFIAALNYKYKCFYPDRYEKLHLNPELSPMLRASIAT